MRLLQSRLAVAILLIPALYFVITTAPPLIFSGLSAAAILRAQYEFYKIYYPGNSARGTIGFGLTCGFFLLCLFYRSNPFLIVPFLILMILAILLFHLFFFRQIQSALADSAVLAIGILYVVVLLGHLILIRQRPGGEDYILFLLIVVWGNDAGAYYVGRAVGGKKLYPAVSPNKTISGSIGGFIVGVFLGYFIQVSFLPQISVVNVILIALVLVAAGQLGDLVESLFKRSGGVKDSSSFIPAHGGLLDKLDGVAFAAPLLYYYMVWMLPL
jgi:phosphatidate cytidylyltransferase